MPPEIVKLLVEIWIEYAIGMLFIFARILVRLRLVGLRNFDVDDYLIFLTAALWTTVATIAHVFIVDCGGQHTGILPPDVRAALTPEGVQAYTYGTQMFLFGLSIYFCVVWTLKINMLFFYRRVVKGTWTERLVVPVMGLVVGSFLVIVLTMTLTCRPFHALWQVLPDPGPNCTPQNKVFFITILVFNIVTDACIMMIPIPVVWGIRASIWKQLAIYFCFVLGSFIMMAAILRYTLIFNLNMAGISASWSIREDFVAIIVGQGPMCAPVLRRTFWTGNGQSDSSAKAGNDGGHELGSMPDSTKGSKNGGSSSKKRKDPFSITQIIGTVNESEENMVDKSDKSEAPSTISEMHEPPPEARSGEVMVSRCIEVKRTQHAAAHAQYKNMQKSWYYEVA
ncbi:hypothetical protein GE09DRAFT_1227357 [Coniochaeta sp. 2T2.1]|nr:hypothetical protein GE09DRAFT_1227357 [Coniochaeta sp. 2T2.1]